MTLLSHIIPPTPTHLPLPTQQEVEDTVVEFLEKGAVLEVDILANLKTVLPAEVAGIITEFVPAPQTHCGWRLRLSLWMTTPWLLHL